MNNIYNNVVNNVNNRLWKRVFLWVQRRMDLHWGLVLLKDLPKTTNTVRYFHAQIKITTDKSYLQRSKNGKKFRA
jgi:hypothetical protein